MKADLSKVRRPLLDWYRRHARDLPWRRTNDPWAIWVSEIMLQQTRVETALPYYLKFMKRFPTLSALARAREDDVLAEWAGLGYYRRARQLQAAAREVVREHLGRVPSDSDAFGALAGVGPYTKAAVQSIAFGAPLAVLDGNVARVLCRLRALRVSVRTPSGARTLQRLADAFVPMRNPGDWNQAMMELGAVICTPRAPRCEACPLRRQCRAHALGRVEAYPPAAARRSVVRVRRAVVLIERRGRVLVARRSGAHLDGLWEPPGVELRGSTSVRAQLRAALRSLGIDAALEPTGGIIKHVITHHAIEVEVWRGTIERMNAAPGVRFVDATPKRVALTALARRLIGRAGSVRPHIGRSRIRGGRVST
jgi:A/G-specific adenine glycosylase